MQSLMITLLICSFTMSALAFFYMAITPLLAKRYSATSRYYTWIVIVIGLIVPFRPQFNNAIIKVDMPSNTVVPNIQIGNGTPVTTPLENVLSSASPNNSLWQIAAAVWLTGMIIFLVYHVIKHYNFLKLVARWSKDITDEQTLILFQNLKSQLSISKNIGLQFCDSIGSPMMIGFAHPRILLPKTDFAKDELSFILKHELVHYQRKDLWYKCLVLIATAIHWFNPIVYFMVKAIDIQCELSCDEKVVRGTSADTRLYYSETIIGVVKYQSKLKTSLSTNFYGGKKGMKKRIFSIMDTSKKKVGFAVLCSTLILTLGTGFVFATLASAQEDNDNTMAGAAMAQKIDANAPYQYSIDNGSTWISEDEYNTMYPQDDIVWWTYEEYKAWIEEQKVELPKLIGTDNKYLKDGKWIGFTQQSVDESIRRYENLLEEIKNGAKLSKTVNGDDSIAMIITPPKDGDVGVSYGASITAENGSVVDLGIFSSKEEQLTAVKQYCTEQVNAGKMSQTEADQIIKEYE